MSTLTLTAERPALGPLLATVIPLGRPVGAAREPRLAQVPLAGPACDPEVEGQLGVECALPAGFTPY